MKKLTLLLFAIMFFRLSVISNEFYTIKNEYIQIKVKKKGAELCQIKNLKNDKEYMWSGDPKVWGGFSPILFPVIGALKDGKYILDGKEYSMRFHGFIEHNTNIELYDSSENHLTFILKYSDETYKMYPYEFNFLITFTIERNKLIVSHEVKNLGDKIMYFSLGGHPAFQCPVDENEEYSDYYLEFEKVEDGYRSIMERDLVTDEKQLVLDNTNILPLSYKTFEKGALVFEDLKSRNVSLCSKKYGKRVQVDYTDFPYIGLWAFTNSNYVCIEPWIGINDYVNTDQNFKTKVGNISVDGKKSFFARYIISVF